MEKRWKILQADESKVDTLQQSLKINRTLCSILATRGFDTYEKTRHYFRPQLSDLHDPWLMKDM
ncbi:MAG: single-stranded-DNA-specific exonuclease RecJ, partial [Ferruginibacter sp.]